MAATASQLRTPGWWWAPGPTWRSDIFSLRATIYEMVTGRRPFEGATPAAVASAILTTEPSPLARYAPDAPFELERIVFKALRKSPDARYQTAEDLLIDLRAVKEDREFQHRLEREPLERVNPPVATLQNTAVPAPAAVLVGT